MPIDNSTRFPKPLAADLRELSEGMAIVIDGNTAPKAIAFGQYLFIKNHSTLATGGYHATAAIARDTDITSSNVTPDADGIVNGAFSSLSEHMKIQKTYTASDAKGFLEQILDYARTLGAGNYVMGITWQHNYFCNVNISIQSSTRCVASVFPQPANISEFFICEYNNGTYTYKKCATSNL